MVKLIETYWSEDGKFFIVTEYLPNSLHTLINKASSERCRFNPTFIQTTSFDLLSALEDLQSYEIVHGDIKPENIMFDSDDKMKLIDFGYSLPVQEYNNSRPGTHEYLNPETFTDHTFGLGY